VTVRAKYQVWKGEHAGIAVGGDVRFPSGEALNYLGSGAYGVKPFMAFSYSFRRVSTHLNTGYEWNGSSLLAGDISPSQTAGAVAPSKSPLPGQFFYSAGAEVGIHKKLSAAVDYLGQYLTNATRVAPSVYKELAACTIPAPAPGGTCSTFSTTQVQDADFRQFKGSYTTANAALGLRYRPFGKLLLTANVVVKLNDAGLRSRYIPLLGISYSH
jgi:hypothetical protein